MASEITFLWEMKKFHFFHPCLFESKITGHSSAEHALYIEI